MPAVSRRRRVTLCLQVRSHLPGQHFDEPRPVHADSLPVVGGILHRGELPRFIHRATSRNAVVMIERQAFKGLRNYKDFCHAVAASAWAWHFFTARTSFCFVEYDMVKISFYTTYSH